MPYSKEQIGYQKNKASKEAAEFNVGGKLTIKDQVKNYFQDQLEATTEETALALNRAEISVQPRISELKNQGILCDSGRTKMGKWGTSITIWELI